MPRGDTGDPHEFTDQFTSKVTVARASRHPSRAVTSALARHDRGNAICVASIALAPAVIAKDRQTLPVGSAPGSSPQAVVAPIRSAGKRCAGSYEHWWWGVRCACQRLVTSWSSALRTWPSALVAPRIRGPTGAHVQWVPTIPFPRCVGGERHGIARRARTRRSRRQSLPARTSPRDPACTEPANDLSVCRRLHGHGTVTAASPQNPSTS